MSPYDLCGCSCHHNRPQHETQTGESPDFERGLASCLRHRCAEHMTWMQINETANGAECGACVATEQTALAEYAARSRTRSIQAAIERIEWDEGCAPSVAAVVRKILDLPQFYAARRRHVSHQHPGDVGTCHKCQLFALLRDIRAHLAKGWA